MSKIPEGYRLPVCHGLIQVPTILGITREAFILNVLLALVFAMVLRAPYLAVINLGAHYILGEVCKEDPLVIKIFLKKYLKQKDYFYEG